MLIVGGGAVMGSGVGLVDNTRQHPRMGPYELLGKIAHGGMGTVYLCRRMGAAGFRRVFAIKVVHEHLNDEQHFVDMLVDEAFLASRIHHPNVVSITDLGEQDGRYYVVMDYIEGGSLSQLLKLSGADRPPRARREDHHRRARRATCCSHPQRRA